MTRELVSRRSASLSAAQRAELDSLAARVREHLHRTAEGVLAVGTDLIRAKALLGHGQFGDWLDGEFSLSRRTAEQFMAAARRFGGKNEIVSHLPAGALLELSSPSVPDDLVDRVLAGDVPASPSAIRAERGAGRLADRSYAVAGTFIDYLERFRGTDRDFAAAIAAHVLRKWKEPKHRAWFAQVMRMTAEMIEGNVATKIPLLELPRSTVRNLKERYSPVK